MGHFIVPSKKNCLEYLLAFAEKLGGWGVGGIMEQFEIKGTHAGIFVLKERYVKEPECHSVVPWAGL
jgi:hypothetical protein